VKLLVTGGAGYIGGVVTHALVEAGHQVTVLDDLSTGFEETIPAGVDFHRLPVHQASQVLTPDAGFEGVLHFAAKIEVAESVARPDLYWHVNVGGTMALLAAVRAAGVPRLIFSSTGSMYDPTSVVPLPSVDGHSVDGPGVDGPGVDGPGVDGHSVDGNGGGFSKLTEDAVIRPKNPYAATKLTVDLMLAGECEAFGLGAASLRYFNASGAVLNGQGVGLGERHTPESHLIPIVLQVAGGKRDQLMLYGDDYPTPDGSCVRDYIHVCDLATAHLLALAAIKPGAHEVYNLGNGDGYSNKQVIETAREVTGHPIPVKLAPRRPGDPAATVAASDKARRVLGWRQERPALHDIIADAWAFHTSVW
jgi:UDP-glucose 4-epimerase